MDANESRAKALELAVEMLCTFGSVRVPDVVQLAGEYTDFILGLPYVSSPPTVRPETDVAKYVESLGPGGLWGPPCYSCGHVQGTHLDVTRKGCQFESADEGGCICPRFQTAPAPAAEPETPKAKCTCHRHSHDALVRGSSGFNPCRVKGCSCRSRGESA